MDPPTNFFLKNNEKKNPFVIKNTFLSKVNLLNFV